MREQTGKLIKRVEEKTDQVEYCAGDLIVSYKGYDNGSKSWEVNEGPFASFS